MYIIYLYSYNRPFECNLYANVARDEIEFDTPALNKTAKKKFTDLYEWS